MGFFVTRPNDCRFPQAASAVSRTVLARGSNSSGTRPESANVLARKCSPNSAGNAIETGLTAFGDLIGNQAETGRHPVRYCVRIEARNRIDNRKIICAQQVSPIGGVPSHTERMKPRPNVAHSTAESAPKRIRKFTAIRHCSRRERTGNEAGKCQVSR